MELTGDLSGIRTSHLQELKSLCELKSERDQLVNPMLAQGLARLTTLWNREIAIYINRSGFVQAVAIGRHSSVNLPALKGRAGGKYRCLHTHPNGDQRLSLVDLSALQQLSLESMAAFGVKEGKITGFQVAFRREEGKISLLQINPDDLGDFDYSKSEINFPGRTSYKKNPGEEIERAFLLGLADDNETSKASIKELAELARTAGIKVVGEISQNRRYGNGRTYVGSGKLEEVYHKVQETGANILICDDELLPLQQRTLEEKTGLKVLDRTTIILDIFAQRAHSREGKLQVELAQLQHLLPFLSGKGVALSRLGGGVGTRGPGETKLEVDRRRIRQRLSQLEHELATVIRERETQRQQRLKSGIPLIALVGYTNAGKTTFLQRALEQAGSRALAPVGENKLFATLDPVVRRLHLDRDWEILLSDTVGFIQKLPHQLLRAFLATLEEVQKADLLLHILDVSHPMALEHTQTVRDVLLQLGCGNKTVITILNKVDKVTVEAELERLAQQVSHPVRLSLLRGDSLQPVWDEVMQQLAASSL